MLDYQLNQDNLPVTIEVFNMLGQKVVTLVDESLGKGKYTVPVLNHGSQLDSGSYLIRIKVGGYSQTQILQIVR